ncbi:MAG: efflux RND transporter periplasmic adaptor subunit [Porticoccus sp.]
MRQKLVYIMVCDGWRETLNANVRIALIILVLITVWFASGVITRGVTSGGADDPEKNSSPTDTSLTKVRVDWVEAEDYSRQVVARGRTKANRQVTLRAEVSGKVVAVPVDKGMPVNEGDTICELAKEDREQRVVEAKAEVARAEIEYRGALKLKQKGYQSDVAIAQSKARLESARADLSLKQLNLLNTKIVASFSGFIDSRPVEIGDYMDRNNVCAELVEMNPLKVVSRLSEREVVQVSVGSTAKIHLATGEEVTGSVVYLSHLADPQTRTYEMEIILSNIDYRLRAGVASQVLVSADQLRAHHVPASLLSLGDSGEIGLKALDDEGRVQFIQVSLVGDDGEGVWVTGLPQRIQLITVGQEYVTAGEQVVSELDKTNTVDHQAL